MTTPPTQPHRGRSIHRRRVIGAVSGLVLAVADQDRVGRPQLIATPEVPQHLRGEPRVEGRGLLDGVGVVEPEPPVKSSISVRPKDVLASAPTV